MLLLRANNLDLTFPALLDFMDVGYNDKYLGFANTLDLKM